MAVTATAPARVRDVREGHRLIKTITLVARPMTPEAFAPYGEIIGERGDIRLDLGGGNAGLASQTVEARPLSFDFLGRHEKTEQVFAPIGGTRSIIAVALTDEENRAMPNADRMAAFIIDGSCAFKLHRGTWHTSAFPLGESATFLVIDREGTLENDYDLRDLKTSLGVVVEIRND